MSEQFEEIATATSASLNRAADLIGRLFEVARPGAVFSEPVSAEGHTVITAAEIYVGMGFGLGMGGGSAEAEQEEADPETSEPSESESNSGSGGGGGGGGTSMSRPVAAIIIGADGVRVEPIVDATKIALAFFTMLGSIFFMLRKMRKGRR